MPDVSSTAPARVRTWVAIDQHKLSLVAAALPSSGGQPEVTRLENTERAIRRFIDRLGDPEGLAVAYEAGPGGYELHRLLSSMGVACDVIAPSLIPVRAGDRVKTDRRDAKKLVRLYRAGELSFVQPPSPMQEGLRDLVRCRDDLRCARTAARHRVAKALLRHGHIYREGKAWTKRHRAWIESQHLADPLAHAALEHMLTHLGSLDARIAALDHQLEQLATREPWADPVAWLCSFRGISTHTALGLLADRRLPALRAPARADELPRADTQRVLLRRAAAPRAHHQDRQPPRAQAARRGGLALPPPTPPIRSRCAAFRTRTAPSRDPRLAGASPPQPPPPLPFRTRQALHHRKRRRRT
jgi:transposase